MRWRAVGLGLVAVLASCRGGGDGASRYCDLVKQAQAAVDPLADQAIYTDPARLQAALMARVKTYTDLAARAPAEIQADANTVRDSVIKVNNALRAAGYRSAAANADPAVQAVLSDSGFHDAQTRLATYDANHCAA